MPGIVGQHDRKFGFADVGIGKFGRGGDGAVDHRLGVGFAVPAVGDDEDLGDGKGKLRHWCRISIASRNRLRCSRGGRLWHQGLLAAGRCGKPS